MTRRQIRHVVPRLKAALLAPLVLVIAYLAGVLLRDAWGFAVRDERILAGIVACVAGCAMFLLALLVAAEINAAWLRWAVAQRGEDRRRCVNPACDRVLRRPFASAPDGGYLCMDCVRASARVADLPPVAARGGVRL
jgi:hypothetical protein